MKIKLTSIDKKQAKGLKNTTVYKCVMYVNGNRVDTFEMCKTNNEFWAWTGDTIFQSIVNLREVAAEKLNSKEIVLNGTI